MKVKVHYEKQIFETAEVEVDEDDLRKYINRNVYLGDDDHSLEEVRSEEGAGFWDLVREYLEEEVFTEDSRLVGIPRSPAGPSQYEIDKVEEL